MDEYKISKYLIDNVTPYDDGSYGKYYRASAYLKDKTYIPCVMFGNPQNMINLAVKRFKETEKNDLEYRIIVESFVTKHSCIPIWDIRKVEVSPYAWPMEILKLIEGETVMGWTAFTVLMKDGKLFSYGTSFNFEFFDLPDGYSYNDISEIHNGKVVNNNNLELDFSFDVDEEIKYFREKPMFYCYTHCLPE